MSIRIDPVHVFFFVYGGNSSADFVPTKPYNIKQLRRQASSAKALLKYRSQSPPTPTKAEIN